jgi:hypothetical protein
MRSYHNLDGLKHQHAADRLPIPFASALRPKSTKRTIAENGRVQDFFKCGNILTVILVPDIPRKS